VLDGTQRSASLVCAWACACAFAVFFAGCSTPTTATDVSRDPSSSRGSSKTVIVFGGGLDETYRHTLEDALVEVLTAHGVRATPSYRLYPGALPNKAEARAVLQQAAVEGALVSNLRVKKAKYVEGAPDFWSGSNGPGWGGANHPGHIVTEPVVNFETSLWDLRGPIKVVWSGSVQTDNPSSGRDFVSSLTKEVVRSMVRAGVLPPALSDTEVSYAPRTLHTP
jgi:hypothetical protein